AVCQVVQPAGNKATDFLLEAFVVDQMSEAVLNKLQDSIELLFGQGVADAARQQLVDLAIDESVYRLGGLFAFEHRRDVFREAILQSGNRVENRRARLRRQC